MQKQGCRKQWYRYHFDSYRYQSLLSMGTGTTLSGTITTCILHNGYRYHSLVPVPLAGSAQKMVDFTILTHFSSINFLQFIPYQKSTMESTQNNSKSGLESMKTSFLKLGLFLKIKITKDEVRVWFSYLESLQTSTSKLLDHKGARKWEKIPPKSLLLANPSFSPFSPLFSPQNVFAQK